jgi:5-formyltetrahydrofolate cyclo-ligase
MVSWRNTRSWAEEDVVLRSGEPGPTEPRAPELAQKYQLRERIVHARLRAVDSPAQAGRDAARTAALLRYPPVQTARIVAAYVTRLAEPRIEQFRTELRARGVRILLPRLLADDDLEFAFDVGDLVPGRRGTRAPSGPSVALDQADVVCVPALAVDGDGHRLGQGGGSYDRALTRARPGVPIVALLHPGELLRHVPAEAHDVPVTAVALPGGVVRLRR